MHQKLGNDSTLIISNPVGGHSHNMPKSNFGPSQVLSVELHSGDCAWLLLPSNTFSQPLPPIGPTPKNPFTVHFFSLLSFFPLICKPPSLLPLQMPNQTTPIFSSPPFKHFKVQPLKLLNPSRMRLSVLLLLFLTALAATTPTLVHSSRLLPLSPTITHSAPHHPLKLKLLPFLITLVMPEKPHTDRVLIENQFQTMSSGPSRRGSGH